MENSKIIYQKLEAFIKKFYTNELIKGLILFIGIGLLYFLSMLFVEHFLWLSPIGRTLLFWSFIIVELFLLFRFILFPSFKLFKIKKGIDFDYASKIIGNHFSEVNDQLTNFLQLTQHNEKSELLLASIDQKANNLKPVPFSSAINFKENIKFLPWAIIPLLVLAFFMLSNNRSLLTQSLDRVVHYKHKFLPPAPFSFVVLNKNLNTEEGKDFVLQVKTVGNIVPENAMIFMNNESYYLENVKPGVFEYTFKKPTQKIEFHLEANKVASKDFELGIMVVPTIANFQMKLTFPSYLNKKTEIIKGTGNAMVPEGTKVTWEIMGQHTENIVWTDFSQNNEFKTENNTFLFSKNINQNTEYQILTSNKNVKNYEKINYQITVIKDQFPTIQASNAPDTLKLQKNVILGQISDDNGLTKLQVVYYPKKQPENIKRSNIVIKQGTFDQFYFTFPSNLTLEQGVSYEYYFEVFDNDALHNFKSTKSSVFSHRESTDEEKEDLNLKEQNDNINSLSKSIKNQDKQIAELEKLQKIGKEKNNLEFKDQQKVKDFIQRQKQQDQMMKEFSKKMEENLEQFKTDKKDEFKEQLLERIKNNDKEVEKNQKLLDELQDLTNKIKEEELFDKMDKFKQNSKNQTKNLEQLVELTKKFYVEKKAEQLADRLDKLGDKQDELTNKPKENTKENQDQINKNFDKIQEDLKDLNKENKDLKSPLDIPSDPEEEKSIDKDLQNASEELQKNEKEKAKSKQKSASKKMKDMGKNMMSMMAAGGNDKLEEDVKTLRQILDNLLAFSFSQEDLMKQFKKLKKGAPTYNKNLKLQQDLKLQFKHVDDSLFALSLRNPDINEFVNKEVGEVHYNLDKSIESFADAGLQKGISHQQYTITSSNRLADFLSESLSNMQNQMQMQGMGGKGKPKPGQGKGFQLSDIIQKQKGLGEKMKNGSEKGKEKGEGKSDKPGKDGKGSTQGEGGKDGEGEAGELLEIYKEQQRLKDALQKALEKEGLGNNGQRALDQMKQIEKDILNKGFKNETAQKMLNLNYELLKLENAIQQQGEDNKRKSDSNQKEFNNQAKPLPPALQEYLNSIEILNRQSLPLRPNFNAKVQQYFKKDD
ncbi:DUF4175 family protein [Flavobacterium sp. '19STA2R22 D10 B1']|uniref:DUF4175 family protein n=1 Tax=Flavobacterium aerium TaxID=3037261 RepID=UPI00278BDEBF|nr:DUF4175 family protein [Flavobacterium sp. '19STA2R22 D10 B1']